MTTGVITRVSNGSDNPRISAELRTTLHGMMTSLEYSSVGIQGQVDQPYSMDLSYDPRHAAYKIEWQSDTTSDSKTVMLPVSRLSALITTYADMHGGGGFARDSDAKRRTIHQRSHVRDAGAVRTQQMLKQAGVDVPFDTAETLFRVIATEHKFEMGASR